MATMFHTPVPPLDAAVACIWYHDSAGAAPVVERIVPTGAVDVVFDLVPSSVQIRRDDGCRWQTHRGPVISGPRGRAFTMSCPSGRSSAGIGFHPGAAAWFLGVPLSEVAGRHVALEDVWGRAALDLRDRLADARSPRAAIALLENELRNRFAGRSVAPPMIAHALRRFDSAPADARVGQFVRSTGFSSRHFISVFEAAVGLTPKRYCRVRRLQSAIEALRTLESVRWAAFALDAGYYDQAHLIRDFREIAGVTPVAYVAKALPGSNHVPVA